MKCGEEDYEAYLDTEETRNRKYDHERYCKSAAVRQHKTGTNSASDSVSENSKRQSGHFPATATTVMSE